MVKHRYPIGCYQCALCFLSDSSTESNYISDVSEKQNKGAISEKSNGSVSDDERIQDNLSGNEFGRHMHVRNFSFHF